MDQQSRDEAWQLFKVINSDTYTEQFDELIVDSKLADDLGKISLDIARNPYIFELISPFRNVYGITIECTCPPPLTIYFRIDEEIMTVELLEIIKS